MIRALVDSDAVESASALPRVRAIVQRARGISVAGATRCPQGTRSVSENGRSVRFASPDPANPAYPRNVVPTRNSISMGTRQRSIVQDHGQQHTQAVRARLMDRRSPAGVDQQAALRSRESPEGTREAVRPTRPIVTRDRTARGRTRGVPLNRRPVQSESSCVRQTQSSINAGMDLRQTRRGSIAARRRSDR